MSGAPGRGPLLAGAEAKACCATAYESDAARWLLGDVLHPGGRDLTLRAASVAGLAAGERALDIASGAGVTACLLAAEAGVDAVGVDYGREAVARARRRADAAGLAARVSFVQGDAEALPLADAGFDFAICECSMCTFPDKEAAASEMARVLRPGGRLAITDMTARFEDLPEALRNAASQVACVADALPLDGYVALLEQAGLRVTATEDHSDALRSMIDRAEARLRAARIIGGALALGEYADKIELGIELSRSALAEVAAGRLGYSLLVAERA
ncbi:MAG TPA: methyltransferase domain-containing protein [Thermoleophilaceae bacterium]|nr:methyltransferase domain-containing protein [Thermoleophilaceae bacterium]